MKFKHTYLWFAEAFAGDGAWFYSTSANRGHSATLSFRGMNENSHRALFFFKAAQRRSLNKLSLFSNHSSWLGLFCSPLKICPDTVGILSFSLKSQSSTLSVPNGWSSSKGPPSYSTTKTRSLPPRLEANWSCGFFPIRVEHKETPLPALRP